MVVNNIINFELIKNHEACLSALFLLSKTTQPAPVTCFNFFSLAWKLIKHFLDLNIPCYKHDSSYFYC